MKKIFINYLSNIFLLVIGFSGIIIVNFATHGRYKYLFLLIPLVCILAAVLYVRQILILKETLNEFTRRWGKRVDRKRNFHNIRHAFDYIKSQKDFYLDDQTWSDLTMDEVFSIVDRTLTSPGEEILYSILKTPIFDEEILKNRDKIISVFEKNIESRESLALELIKINKKDKVDIPSLLWKDIDMDLRWKPICKVLSIIPYIVPVIILLAFKDIRVMIATYIVLIIINILIHIKLNNKIYMYSSSIGYLNNLICASNKISKLDIKELRDYKEILNQCLKPVKSISKKAYQVNRIEGTGNAFTELFYMISLIKENEFFSCIKVINNHKKDLKKIYISIGELDAFLSIASYRCSLNNYCNPQFTSRSKYFSAEDIIHPLLEKAVPNSISMDSKGIILTGSNMSGKSTFLRTIGVNTVLAQSIYTVTASSYHSGFFKVMTSISPEDNIMIGKSYYFREAEAILRIIREKRDNYNILCVIDEVFRGTNPIERVNASIEILNYFQRNDILAIVATHDMELAEELKDKYGLYYFIENINEQGMIFDYKLRNGICKSRNAVKLLKILHYPKEIIGKIDGNV
ncbi:MutS-related protein [Clostridium pasteurianum]|uniref:Mismatch repair ATPase (MutS family) n=1 Tax=Clostridium pasteurianum BC1 TaxID=86416 RepID=R4KA61_CLOPA|nr:mismatch repair ATPase (MutS family) [Clostridium pasteurianum]AGK96500.1 mismatch repair ATPase (MutS family) [Clostridium pasteurianum BC1]